MIRSIVVAICVNLAFAAPCIATPILDQFHEPDLRLGNAAAVGPATFAQTFTVGISGVLSYVEIALSKDASAPEFLTMEIQTTALDGRPSDVVLGTVDIPRSSITLTTDYIAGDFAGQYVLLGVGDILAIVLRAPSQKYLWATAPDDPSADPYSFGEGYRRWPTGWECADCGDFGFRTYVTPIPEPTTPLLTDES